MAWISAATFFSENFQCFLSSLHLCSRRETKRRRHFRKQEGRRVTRTKGLIAMNRSLFLSRRRGCGRFVTVPRFSVSVTPKFGRMRRQSRVTNGTCANCLQMSRLQRAFSGTEPRRNQEENSLCPMCYSDVGTSPCSHLTPWCLTRWSKATDTAHYSCWVSWLDFPAYVKHGEEQRQN